MEPEHGDEKPHLPSPTLWPIGFAVGVAVLLVGFVVSWPAVAVGAAIALVFGFLWIRDVTTHMRGRPEVEPESEAGAEPAAASAAAPAVAPGLGERERFPRDKFLEASTLGLGAAIGAVVTIPPLFLALIPPFLKQGRDDIDLGPLDNYPEGKFVIATFISRPDQGEVSERTAFIRYNGLLENPETRKKEPSFTVVSNRCVHLGCPTQPNGKLEEPKVVKTDGGDLEVRLIPLSAIAGFSCPCHGGAYDPEGNRTAGPPVRALDRYEFSIRKGRLYLGKYFSVGSVSGTGAKAQIEKYKLAGPGQHVDGVEQILYPLQPPSN